MAAHLAVGTLLTPKAESVAEHPKVVDSLVWALVRAPLRWLLAALERPLSQLLPLKEHIPERPTNPPSQPLDKSLPNERFHAYIII